MAGEKILVVEDEKALVKILRYNLENAGYRVVSAGDGQAGLLLCRQERPDLVILDLMLPKVDGFEFCKALRRDSQTPILMLTARKAEVDRILGLELGADDYVTKPFSVREVLARVKAILKRASGQAAPRVIRAGSLEVDLERYETRVQGAPIHLSPKEFAFLRCLVEADGKALSRDILLEKVWGYDKSMDIDTRTIDQHIARMREKLGPESARIITVKGMGYRIKLD